MSRFEPTMYDEVSDCCGVLPLNNGMSTDGPCLQDMGVCSECYEHCGYIEFKEWKKRMLKETYPKYLAWLNSFIIFNLKKKR